MLKSPVYKNKSNRTKHWYYWCYQNGTKRHTYIRSVSTGADGVHHCVDVFTWICWIYKQESSWMFRLNVQYFTPHTRINSDAAVAVCLYSIYIYKIATKNHLSLFDTDFSQLCHLCSSFCYRTGQRPPHKKKKKKRKSVNLPLNPLSLLSAAHGEKKPILFLEISCYTDNQAT